jgi:hypothetical protein
MSVLARAARCLACTRRPSSPQPHMADSSDEPDVAPSSSTDVDALAHRLEAWFWRKGPARGKAQARDARGRFLPKPKVVESNTQQASTTPFFTTRPLSFMSPSFSPMSEASSSSFPSQVCPPNLLQAFTMPNPSPLWVAGAHASLATRCLQLLDALASVLVVASSPSSSSPPLAPPVMNHTVFTQPPYAEATTSFPCLLVDPKAVDAHPHMELNKGYLRLWLTTHTKDGKGLLPCTSATPPCVCTPSTSSGAQGRRTLQIGLGPSIDAPLACICMRLDALVEL